MSAESLIAISQCLQCMRKYCIQLPLLYHSASFKEVLNIITDNSLSPCKGHAQSPQH